MKKSCKIIILVFFVLALIGTGFLFYIKWQESKMGLVSFEEATKQEINGKVYIENKGVGLSFAVPDGWNILKDSAGLSMHSSNFVPLSEDSFFIPKSGCWIEALSEILKSDDDYDLEYGDLRLMIDDQNYLAQKSSDKKKLEVVEISTMKGIRSNFLSDSNPDNIGNFIYTAIPYKNILYVFNTYLFGEDKEICLQKFNNFLTTVTIKK